MLWQPLQAGAGFGATVNLPLPPGATGDVYLELFDRVIAPSVAGFDPSWVLVSAGFDAHRSDPLGGMGLTSGDFSDLTGRLLDLTVARGRLAFFLEGGYDLQAVRLSVQACASRLLGDPNSPEPGSTGGTGIEWGIGFEIGLTALLVYVPACQHLLGTAPLPAHWLALTLAFPVIVWGADEFRRYVARRRSGPSSAALQGGPGLSDTHAPDPAGVLV